MDKKKILKKAGRITADVLLYAFIIICIFLVILTITSKKDGDGTATVFGMQMRTVMSSSMEKCDATDVSEFDIKDIPTKSMVFIKTVPKDAEKANEWYASLRVGDVLTFKYVYVRQETITHRIIDIDPNSAGGYTIVLEGDNKEADSQLLTQTIDTSVTDSPNYVIGKVVGQSYALGALVSALREPVTLVCLIIVPSLIILFYEIFKLYNMYGQEKKKKYREEKEAQQLELDELKKRLAELEAKRAEETHAGQADPAELPPNGEGASDDPDSN